MRAKLRSLVGSASEIRSWAPSTWLLAISLGTWLGAQFLPAAVVPMPGENGGPEAVPGLVFTLFGGVLAGLSAVVGLVPEGRLEGVAGVLGFVGWLANVCLAAMLYLRWRGIRPRRALVASIAGLLCSIAGVAALYLDSFFVKSVGIGTWVWVASFAIVLLSMALWRPVDRGEAARADAEAAATDELRQAGVASDLLSLDPTGLGCWALVLGGLGILAAPIVAWEIAGPIGIFVLALLVVALVAWIVWPRGDDSGPPPPATGPRVPPRHH